MAFKVQKQVLAALTRIPRELSNRLDENGVYCVSMALPESCLVSELPLEPVVDTISATGP